MKKEIKTLMLPGMTAVAALTMTACWNPQEMIDIEEKPAETKLFTFHPKGEFEVNYGEMGNSDASGNATTRAAERLENSNTAGVTDLWALDYYDHDSDPSTPMQLVQQVHQASTDNGFGSVQMALLYGQHEVKFIASKGTEPTLTATNGTASPHSIAWAKVLDTFTLSYPIEVSATSNGNRAPELQRAVGGLKVVMKDEVPATAHHVDMVWQNSKSLALPGLTSATPQEVTQVLNFPQSFIGKAGKEFSAYTFIPEGGITTDVILTFKDSEGAVISTRTIPNVDIQRNRMSVLTGNCFSAQTSAHTFGVGIQATWETPDSKDF